jgi:photosystem II stability/assembly factor-like uncharacterized protein
MPEKLPTLPRFVDATHWYGLEGSGFFRTGDAGRSWSATRLPRSLDSQWSFFLNPDVGWVATRTDDDFLVLRTTDGGVVGRNPGAPRRNS